MSQPMGPKQKSSNAFTIVELLVVIVIIAILAAISLVAYTGISQRAVVSLLQSDLSNAVTAIKAFQVENSNFPTTISTDCSANPDTTTNKCIKMSGSNSVVGYSANNQTTPKTFLLIANNGSTVYKITDSTSPTQLTNSMQPGVTMGAAVELHGAKASGGTSQGINSPLTTTWADTSGNSNNGTLTNFGTQTPWSGAGTAGDPYRLGFDGVDDYVGLTSLAAAANKVFTYEAWVYTPSVTPTSYQVAISESGLQPGGDPSYPLFGLMINSSGGKARMYYRDSKNSNPGVYGPGSTNVCDGNLHHFVAVSDSSTARLYVDGTSGTAIDVSAVNNSILNQTSIGKGRGSTEYPWVSSIVTVRIYPFALTTAQVTANYNAGADW